VEGKKLGGRWRKRNGCKPELCHDLFASPVSRPNAIVLIHQRRKAFVVGYSPAEDDSPPQSYLIRDI
jgi:hypothetical protein